MKTASFLLDGIPELPGISTEAADSYAFASNRLLTLVVANLERRPDFSEITAASSHEALRLREQHHSKIMANMLKINDRELIAWTNLCHYHTCLEQDHSGVFFLEEIAAWRTALEECLTDRDHREELLAFYGWLALYRNKLHADAATWEGFPFPHRENFTEVQQLFLVLLLRGDYQGCLNLGNRVIQNVIDLKQFNLKVIWPVLYRIGLLWQSGQISIADEHLVTNLVKRVATVQHSRFATLTATRGKVVVSAVANEYHEVGAQMVADFLEIEGWDVTYLGANVPGWILLETIRQNKPFLLALSIALEGNLMKIQQLIEVIREDPELKDIKIMVGGNAFSRSPLSWKQIGADGFASDADSATKLAHEWWSTLLARVDTPS
jgi:MerR family transcriptional regulator, light-induced transcriptional regulator